MYYRPFGLRQSRWPKLSVTFAHRLSWYILEKENMDPFVLYTLQLGRSDSVNWPSKTVRHRFR